MIVTYATDAYDPREYHPPGISTRAIDKRNFTRSYMGLTSSRMGAEGILEITIPDKGTHIVRVHQTKKVRPPGSRHFQTNSLYATVHNGQLISIKNSGNIWSPYEFEGIEQINQLEGDKVMESLISELAFARENVRSLVRQIRSRRQVKGRV